MKKTLLLLLLSTGMYAQVGVGTSTPQEALHIASPTGTMRIESLNETNSEYNGGDVDGDGDLTDDTFPLYVDENGDFTLELVPLYNSEDSDPLDHTGLPNSSVSLLATDADGVVNTEITSYTITVNRQAILEVKYNISFEVYENALENVITDNLARKVTTYFQVTGFTRRWGPTSKCYSSGTSTSVTSTMYNACTAYIDLPAAGTYTISFYGEVDSGTKGGGGGTTSKNTFVKFATGNDTVLMRLH